MNISPIHFYFLPFSVMSSSSSPSTVPLHSYTTRRLPPPSFCSHSTRALGTIFYIQSIMYSSYCCCCYHFMISSTAWREISCFFFDLSFFSLLPIKIMLSHQNGREEWKKMCLKWKTNRRWDEAEGDRGLIEMSGAIYRQSIQWWCGRFLAVAMLEAFMNGRFLYWFVRQLKLSLIH